MKRGIQSIEKEMKRKWKKVKRKLITAGCLHCRSICALCDGHYCGLFPQRLALQVCPCLNHFQGHHLSKRRWFVVIYKVIERNTLKQIDSLSHILLVGCTFLCRCVKDSKSGLMGSLPSKAIISLEERCLL